MRLLNVIKENPVEVLCVAVAALIAWVAVDLSKAPPSKPRPGNPDLAVQQLPLPVRQLPLPEGVEVAHPSATTDDVAPPVQAGARGTAVSTAVLPKLKPGMTRAEVENLLGPPDADRVQPVSLNEGRPTYRTAYDLDDLGAPMTIRPIQPRLRSLPMPEREPRTPVVALVFDASRAGHPLVEVLYPDPLF